MRLKTANFISKLGVFHKYFYSNVIVFLIPFVLLGYFTFFTSVERLNEAIKTNFEDKFMQMSSDLDKQFANMASIALEVSSNTLFIPSTLKQYPFNELEALKQLKRYHTQLFLPQKTILYYKGDNVIYSSEGKYDQAIFFKNEIEVPQWSKLLEKADQSVAPFFTSLNDLSYRTIGLANSLIYAYPIPTSNTENRDAVLVYFITEQALKKRIENSIGSFEGSFDIYLSNGEHLFTVGAEQGIGEADMLSLLKEEDASSVSINRNKQSYHVLKKTENYGNLTYMMATPSSSLLQKAEQLKNGMLIVMLILLFCGLIAAWYFAYLNYYPIKRLQNFIKKSLPSSGPSLGKNEWTDIKITLSDTFNHYAQLKVKSKEQILFFQQNLLYSLLKGHWDKHANARLDEHSLKLDSPYYAVMTIMSPEQSDADQLIFTNEHVKQLRLYGKDTEKFYAVELVDEGCLAVICNLDNKSIIEVQELAAKWVELCEAAEIKLQIGIGNIYNKLEEVRISYIEAISAIELHAKNQGVVLFCNITEQYSDQIWYPSEQLLRVFQAVKQGDREITDEMLDCLKIEVENRNLSTIMEKLIRYEVLNALLKTWNKLNISISQYELNMLSEATNFAQFINRIIPIAHAACDQVRQTRQSQREQKVQDILGYIAVHFKEYDLNLEGLADHFGLSTYALTKYLRDETGMGFKDYIIKLRMNEAKKLLNESDKSVNDITAEIGYSNASHFIKTFKKLEGITPVEFRALQSD
jgi:two-component system response regulator YesN